MKKTVVLMTIVLALLAAPVFAEVTLEGDVDFGWSTDFGTPNKIEDGDRIGFRYKVDDLDLDFTGTVGEFNTVTFGLSWDGNVTDGTAGSVGSFTLKSDVTGAFGIEAPVDFLMVTGWNDYYWTQGYDSATRYALDDIADKGIRKGLVIGGDLTIMDLVTLSVGVNPVMATADGDATITTYTVDPVTGNPVPSTSTVEDGNNYYNLPVAMFFGAYGTYEMISAEAYFNVQAINSFGLSALAEIPMDALDLDVSASMNMDMADGADTAMLFGAGVKATMGAFDAGLSALFKNDAAGTSGDSEFGIGFDAGYAVTDFLTFYGGASIKNLMADDMYFTATAADEAGIYTLEGDRMVPLANAGMELGAEVGVGEATYMVGYTMGAGKINNVVSNAEGIFFRVKAAF